MSERLIETRYKVVQPNELSWQIEDIILQWPLSPGLDRIREVLRPIFGDSYTERVAVWASFENDIHFHALDMFVDEDGLGKGLPRNEVATTVYRQAVLMGKTGHRIPSNPEDLNFIVGPAVLFNRRIWY